MSFTLVFMDRTPQMKGYDFGEVAQLTTLAHTIQDLSKIMLTYIDSTDNKQDTLNHCRSVFDVMECNGYDFRPHCRFFWGLSMLGKRKGGSMKTKIRAGCYRNHLVNSLTSELIITEKLRITDRKDAIEVIDIALSDDIDGISGNNLILEALKAFLERDNEPKRL